jgi:hypothetical protein
MASPPPCPDTGTSQGSGLPPGSGPRAGWSRVKTVAIAVLVVALLA